MRQASVSKFLRTCLLAALAFAPACAAAGSGAGRPSPVEWPPPSSAADFDSDFTGQTLRWSYAHCGTAGEEHVATTGWRSEGEWPGSRTQLVDRSNLGLYRFVLVEAATNRALYSRGFASIFGEWLTTGEAKRAWGSFEESVRFPEPRGAALLVLEKRGAHGAFAEIHREPLDPTGRAIDRAPIARRGTLRAPIEHGPAARKVDLLILADGYAEHEGAQFDADVARLSEVLFETEPFRKRRGDFNVRTLHVPSDESGISNPRANVWRKSALQCSFNAFDSDRYVLTYADRELRELAAQAPYDALILLFNARKYGGGGIYNLWSTCAAGSEQAPYLFVHEFGHSFAGLADEYYSSQVAYEDFVPPGVEPWEPNATALLDPARLKWRDLVAPGTPLPTPWGKQRYDELDLAYQKKRAELAASGGSDDAAEALFREVKQATQPLLEAEPHHGAVGAFEGAAYQARGLYRPEVDCIMFTRNPTHFCAVCERAVERVIDLYAR